MVSAFRMLFTHDGHVRRRLHAVLATELGGALAERPSRLLDLGCGDRPYAHVVRELGADYVAADLDGEVDVKVVPGAALPVADGLFDCILSNQVLEHVWDLDWYLGECHRLLKPNGSLLLSTHGTWLYHPHPTDFRRWTRDGLTKELTERGFEVERMHAVVGPLAWTTQILLLAARQLSKGSPLLSRGVLPLVSLVGNGIMAVQDWLTPPAIRMDNAVVYVVSARRA